MSSHAPQAMVRMTWRWNLSLDGPAQTECAVQLLEGQ